MVVPSPVLSVLLAFVGTAAIVLGTAWADAGWAAELIDGRAVPRLLPQRGWTPTRLADRYAATSDNGWICLTAGGQGKQMTWVLTPKAAEMAGEPRYLQFRYKAFHIDTRSGDMVLSVQTSSPTWFHLVGVKDLVADGEEHVVAVDLASYQFVSPVERFLLRVGPAATDEARLLVKIEQTNTQPEAARVIAYRWPKAETVRLDFEQQKWAPSPNWTPRPPAHHAQETTATGVRYAIEGERSSMRWSSKLAEPIDFSKLPYVVLRYRARGEFGPWGYVFYLGVKDKDGKPKSVYAMQPGDVVADGRWHVFSARLDSKETASGSVAVGIDAISPRAEMELDYIQFSSQPPRAPVAECLDSEPREGPWPAGRDGLTTLDLPRSDQVNPYLLARMGIGSWFDQAEITVEGIPFRVPTDPLTIPSTGTVDEDDLEVPLTGSCNEVLLLVAAAFPHGELFGSSAQRMTPLKRLDEPERASLELVYADGDRDELLPLNAVSGRHGFAHDMAVYAVRPSAGKRPVKLVLHDRLANGSLGIVGLTLNAGRPRIAEPILPQLWYPAVRKAEAAPARVVVAEQGPLTWRSIESAMLGGSLTLKGQPVFRLSIGDRQLDSSQFTIAKTTVKGETKTITADFRDGDTALAASLVLRQLDQQTTAIALELKNSGGKPLTGTLRFPTCASIRLGKHDDTWYLAGRLGGVISNVESQMRDEIGERHPLALDGFFNPRLGAGLCFMPRVEPVDEESLRLAGLFRYYNVGKDASGANYAVEYLPETVAAGRAWQCVPVTLAVTPGDWRDQVQGYAAWLRTWHKPLAPRKEWYRRLWSFVSYGPYYPKTTPAEQRLDFLALAQLRNAKVPGSADYIHLYGWAITDRYGHWGAYDHYDDLGGAANFRKFVGKARAAGQPVGLYLDGYLVSTASDKPSHEQVEAWSIRRADGQKLYHKEYDAHSMCPYTPQWRDYLAKVYARVADEVRPSGMYLDECGRCFPSRTCYGNEHGHVSPQGMCPGEWLLSRQVRQAIPPEIAFYCEFVPADVATQFLDGAYGHVSLDNYREGHDRLAPHFVNLHRFVIPDFKTFELIYYAPLRNGNWFLLKHPFFNGDGYYLTDAKMQGWDARSSAFMTRVLALQHQYVEAFTARDVEPLVRTEQRGLYANCFRTKKQVVWTLYNANYRTVRGPLVTTPRVAGATYLDAWAGKRLTTAPAGPSVTLQGQVGPRSVGCLVEQLP